MKTSDKIIIEELKRIILMQAQELAKIPLLVARIEVLERELARYTTRKDSNNSSMPPSKDENRPPRTSSLREKGARKTGGQPGHKGKTLEMTDTPDEIIEHRACFCTECGKDVSGLAFELFGKRQVIDIPTIKQVVTEHRVYRCKCTCGNMVESDFPVGVESPVRYGKNIETLIGYLSVRQYLPFKRLQEMLNDIFAVQISEGGLHWLLNRLASKGVDAYEMIRQNVLRSRVIGTDETGVKINGKKHWFWTWQNNRATYIVTSTNRGTATINENMSGISGEAVLVHDCWKAHFQTPVKKHQLCTAHLERETKYLEERYKVTWPVRFRVMLREAQKLKKQFAPADYYYPNQLLSHLEKELDNLLSEPLEPKHKDMIAFQKRITKYRDHVFTFLYHPNVPPDNNGSERAIRNVKVKQKISGQFKILSAAENFAILRSIIDTAIKNNRNVVEALNAIADYKIN
ncbi:MAG TPA: IS66 family transposase [Anaerolineae bacterium]|jgi:transposase|nr:IS66 family transposase [Anaerolineae bacterium]